MHLTKLGPGSVFSLAEFPWGLGSDCSLMAVRGQVLFFFPEFPQGSAAHADDFGIFVY